MGQDKKLSETGALKPWTNGLRTMDGSILSYSSSRGSVSSQSTPYFYYIQGTEYICILIQSAYTSNVYKVLITRYKSTPFPQKTHNPEPLSVPVLNITAPHSTSVHPNHDQNFNRGGQPWLALFWLVPGAFRLPNRMHPVVANGSINRYGVHCLYGYSELRTLYYVPYKSTILVNKSPIQLLCILYVLRWIDTLIESSQGLSLLSQSMYTLDL